MTLRHLRGADGFTLVELLIALGIGVTIIAALSASLVLGLGTTEETGMQVQEAAWAQVIGTRFLGDVQGAESTSSSTFGCYESDDPPAGGVFLHRFEWTEPGDWDVPEPEDEEEEPLPPDRTIVDWWVDTDDEAMMRTRCVIVTTVDEDTDELVEEIEGVDEALLARNTSPEEGEEADITCGPSSCNLSWTATKSEAAAESRVRTYEMTVLRRAP